jgi:hemoglobin
MAHSRKSVKRMRKPAIQAIAILVALLILAGCAANRAPPADTQRSLFDRLGGKPAISAVVGEAIRNITVDPRINQRFASANAPNLNRNLVEFLCERSGGPCKYTGLDMSAAHERMFIRDDEFDALVDDLVKALDKFKVPAAEKNEILTMLGHTRNAVTGH